MPFLRRASDTPFGFYPYDVTLSVTEYRATGAGAIFRGDLVGMQPDGSVDTITAAASPILGVALGNITSGTDGTVLVADHPFQRYVVQDDGDTTAMTALSEGAKVDPILTTGDTTTNLSRQEIDSSSAAAPGHAQPIKVIRLHPCEAGSYASAAGSPRRWIVQIANHQLATPTGV